MTYEQSVFMDLTDAEILAALSARRSDLAIANVLAKLVRMFEIAATKNPDAALGLGVAGGLTKLYSQSFAPGHEHHPFPNFGATVQGIVQPLKEAEAEPAIQESLEKIEQPVTPAVPAKIVTAEESIAERIARQRAERLAAVPKPKPPAEPAPAPVVRSRFVPRQFALTSRNSRNENSKARRATRSIMNAQAVKFEGMEGFKRNCTFDGDIRECDIRNCINMLVKEGKLHRTGFGVYQKVDHGHP